MKKETNTTKPTSSDKVPLRQSFSEASESKETAVAPKRRVLEGEVVSDKMKDTIVVKVVRFVKNAKYQKFQKIAKRYKAHDAGNTAKIGEKVKIEECRPISKDKHFTLLK